MSNDTPPPADTDSVHVEPAGPREHFCAFGECGARAWYCYRAPGIENLAHRKPDAPEVWVCKVHQAEGALLLQAKLDAATQDRMQDLTLKARRSEGKLL